MAHILELRRLSKHFPDHVALHDLSAQIAEGEFFSLLGPSGCGKTTLLRMIAGLEQSTEGRLFIGGKDVTLLRRANATSRWCSSPMRCSRICPCWTTSPMA